jgi:hypothetical protein
MELNVTSINIHKGTQNIPRDVIVTGRSVGPKKRAEFYDEMCRYRAVGLFWGWVIERIG